MAATFGGFHPTLFSFLAELELNNEREWFQDHRERYERDVREPALGFIRAMAKPLAPLRNALSGVRWWIRVASPARKKGRRSSAALACLAQWIPVA